jgi:hypothetical protein
LPVHAGAAAVAELAEPSDGLHPAEDFLDAFPDALTDVVAGMPQRRVVQGATLLLLRDVWRGLELTERIDEAVSVIAFVAAESSRGAGARRRSS